VTTALTATTTPAATTALVHEFYRRIDAGDVPALVALFTEDAVYHRPGYPPLVGPREVAHFYTHERVIEESTHRVESVVREGDRVAVRGTFEGVLRDGTPAGWRYAEFFTLADDGRFSERETFFSTPLA